MAPKKLTRPERMVQEQMLTMLEWASDRPNRWHGIGMLDTTQRGAALLEKRGVIEICQPQKQYRIKQQTD